MPVACASRCTVASTRRPMPRPRSSSATCNRSAVRHTSRAQWALRSVLAVSANRHTWHCLLIPAVILSEACRDARSQVTSQGQAHRGSGGFVRRQWQVAPMSGFPRARGDSAPVSGFPLSSQSGEASPPGPRRCTARVGRPPPRSGTARSRPVPVPPPPAVPAGTWCAYGRRQCTADTG